ncbi:MAG TPA: energy-coupling factor ABC transporter ATP-binding protein, partial [Bacillota bacterium]|nr:energy-coupling factor ABC transporter ATP-binding protein [Bacillota bacterium]
LQQGYPTEEVELLVDRVLEQVGIAHLKHRPPYKLSGGEKRMAAIAAVLAMAPDILVLDEPSAALDPMARRRLINLLDTFRHTKIIASHDLDLVLDLCERTIIVAGGEIIADGPTRELFQNEALLVRAHLEKPLRLQECPVCNRANPGGL